MQIASYYGKCPVGDTLLRDETDLTQLTQTPQATRRPDLTYSLSCAPYSDVQLIMIKLFLLTL